MRQHEYLKQMRWEGIKNTSGETCPPFGLLAITGSEQRGTTYKRTVLLGAKPSTTFYRNYAVNGPTAIPDGRYGRCTRMSGGLWMLYDTGTPANGEGWGPKPGQWDAAKGFPGITVEGVKSAERTLLVGTLHEIREVFGKPQSDIAAATSTTQPSTGTVIVQYFDGTEYQATTFELTGTNILPYKIKAGRLYKWVAVGDQWCAVELASRSWAGTIASSVGAGGSISVTLSDGTAHTATNVSGQELETGSVLATDDAYTGAMLISGAAPGGRKFWKCTFNEDIDPGATGEIILSDTSIGTAGVVSATNWTHVHHAFQGRKGFAWKDIDDNYYFIVDGLRWFLALLDADLDAEDLTAAIAFTTSLDGSTVAGVSDVDNQFGYSGVTGDTVLCVESPNAGSEKYVLVAITARAHKPRWFKGLLSATLTSGSATASVDGIAALDGGSAPASATVKNPHSLAGLDNGDVLFCEDWNDLDEEDNPTYILVQSKHLAQTVVTDYRYDTSSHKLQKKTRSIVCMVDAAESDWTDVQAFTGYTMISAIDWNDPKLQRKTRVVYSPETASESAYGDVDDTTVCDT